jgi:hypothetical protein
MCMKRRRILSRIQKHRLTFVAKYTNIKLFQKGVHLGLLLKGLSKYVASFFNMIRINCTPRKCSGFNQMEEAKS